MLAMPYLHVRTGLLDILVDCLLPEPSCCRPFQRAFDLCVIFSWNSLCGADPSASQTAVDTGNISWFSVASTTVNVAFKQMRTSSGPLLGVSEEKRSDLKPYLLTDKQAALSGKH